MVLQNFIFEEFPLPTSIALSNIVNTIVSELGAGAGDQHRSVPATSGTFAATFAITNTIAN